MNETLKRTISGGVYIVLLLTSILYSTESFLILFGIFLIIAIYEFCNIIKINRLPPLLFGISSYTLITLICNYNIIFTKTVNEIFNANFNFYINTNLLDLILLAINLLVSVKCLFFLFNEKIKQISFASKYIYLIGYIILPFIFVTKISFGENNYNPKIIVGLFIMVWVNDTFAYLVGKSIGKHKLLEKVSPKKTIEGFIGGVVFAVISGFLISKFYIQPNPNFSNKSILIWITMAIIVGFIGTIGDLIESKFKRVAGVKDSGEIMPGHGGILDRLDSIIFVAPIIYLFYQILNYVS